jgi:small subunit ribosomal protein S21
MEVNGDNMPEVKIGDNESIDSALRRFQKLCKENAVELKKRKYYEKPSEIRRRRKTRRKS